jgi:hypothetical protein
VHANGRPDEPADGGCKDGTNERHIGECR